MMKITRLHLPLTMQKVHSDSIIIVNQVHCFSVSICERDV